MKNKFWHFIFILIFSITNNLIFFDVSSSSLTNKKRISTDYLDQLPPTDYIIGPGDIIKIIISRELPELSSTVQIDGEGSIFIPFLKRVFVSGLTIGELNKVLNEAYLKYVKSPNVEVIISKYRPLRIFVEGEVVNPGLKNLQGSFEVNSFKEPTGNLDSFSNSQQLNPNLSNIYFPTVFDALRAADGITNFSDLKNVQIIRKNSISNGGGKITTNLNFYQLLTRGDNSQNIRIYDSDIIKVRKTNIPQDEILRKAISSSLNSRFINVVVNGRVKNPGSVKVSRSGSLNDAIDMAGGSKFLKGKVTFVRFNMDGTIDKRKFVFRRNLKRGSYRNPLLKDGDFIDIGENFLTTTNEVISEVTTPFVGLFSTYGLIKAVSE